ncbi:MAG: sodium-dependent transporter [Rikenellaceae bacterium]
MSQPRGSFGSNFGMIAAAAGSAIGLGNIWRFPYVVGENGGAAFIFMYLLIIFIIGMPVLMGEFALGRRTNLNVFGGFRKLAPNTKWPLIGLLGILTSFVILSFYNVVAGWTLSFLVDSVMNKFSTQSSEQMSTAFDSFITSGWKPIIWLTFFIIVCIKIVASGIEKGIEKYNKILMPMLFLILVLLCVNSVTLSGFSEGFRFLFAPDFSKITVDVALSALGQAFFSLSLGMGTMMTYGSYMRKQDNIVRTTTSVIIADVFIALLAGIAIFPAVFSFGIEPTSGADLVFKTLPNIFAQMTGGYILGVLFFLLLVVAAITSAISIFEVLTSYFSEELKFSRKKAVLIVAISVFITSSLCALSMMPDSALVIAGNNLFDAFDKTSAMFMLPIGGFFIALYTGWFFKEEHLRDELSSGGTFKIKYFPIFYFIIKYLAPIMIFVVFLSSFGIF